MEVQETIQQVTAIIRTHLGKDARIILFGSWATGKARSTSDIDIGILQKGKVPHAIMTTIKNDIEKLNTLRSIDILDLNAVDGRLKSIALEQAKDL